jgi:predicted ATPase
VTSAIASALDVPEGADLALEETLPTFLAERELLLCIDNFEHLLEAAPIVSGLVAAAPRLRVLVTSRARLRLAGEIELVVPPLAPSEAEELFVVRASVANPGLVLSERGAEAVREVCTRLDHLPLAIELAAARIRSLSPEKLCDRLGERLPILTQGPRDVPSRQRTLRATLDWSYGLLAPSEQALLSRLSVFAGGCTLEAAEAVGGTDLDTLASLVEQSLLRAEDVGLESRYSMLETVREYAQEALRTRGEEEEYRRRHAEYFRALSETAASERFGPSQLRWLDVLDGELDNFRGALLFAIGSGSAELAVRLATALENLWETRRRSEGKAWLEQALACDDGVPPNVRGLALLALSDLTYAEDFGRMRELLEEAVRLFRRAGDDEHACLALAGLALVAMDSGDDGRSRELLDEIKPLLPGLRARWIQAETRNILGVVVAETVDRESGLVLLEEARGIWEELGSGPDLAVVHNNIACLSLITGDLGRAQELLEQNLVIGRELRDTHLLGSALGNLSAAMALAEDFGRVRTLLHESLPLFRDQRDFRRAAQALVVTASLLSAARGQPLIAACVTGAAEQLHERMGGSWTPIERLVLQRHVWPQREELSEPFELAWAEGRVMSFEAAMELALWSLEAAEGETEPAVRAAVPDLERGIVLAGFEVELPVGRGAMGIVYRARQHSLDRAVALKVLAPELAEDETYRSRFLREARLAASIEHPNVLAVHEAGEARGQLFLAARYVEGEDLGSLLDREGALEPRRAVSFVVQIASALDAAHERDLVHRDVKPSNVLVEHRGGAEHALLADFGLAKSNQAGTTSLTETGQLVGTVNYLAPELIQGEPGDLRSDVYSLGCVLFQLLEGRVPFDRQSPAATAWAHVADDPPSLGLGDAALAARLNLVVHRAMAKEPGDRFATAGELAGAALAALQG